MQHRTFVLYHFIWLILCLTGNVFQIIGLCQSYFRYEVSSQVTIGFLEKFKVPGMALCFSYVDVLNWSTAASEQNGRFKKILRMGDFPVSLLDASSNSSNGLGEEQVKLILEHSKKLSLAQKAALTFAFIDDLTVNQVFKYTLEANVVLDLAKCFTQKTFHFKSPTFVELAIIEKFMHSYRLCYNIQFKNSNEETSLSEVFRDHVLNGMLYFFSFSEEIASRVTRIDVKYAPALTLPRYGFAKDLFTDLVEPILAVTYRKITMKLLPPPFPTKCRNYTKMRQNRRLPSSRSACHENCIYEKSIKFKSGLTTGATIARVFGNLKVVAPPSLDSMHPGARKYWIQLSDFENKCAKRCSELDCEVTNYIPEIYSQLKAPGVKLGIASYVASDPPILISTKQILDFISFITDLASSFNFWLGVSLMNINKFYFDEMAKFHRKKETPMSSLTFTSSQVRRISHKDRLVLRTYNSKQFHWDWYIVPIDDRYRNFV